MQRVSLDHDDASEQVEVVEQRGHMLGGTPHIPVLHVRVDGHHDRLRVDLAQYLGEMRERDAHEVSDVQSDERTVRRQFAYEERLDEIQRGLRDRSVAYLALVHSTRDQESNRLVDGPRRAVAT